MNDDDIQQLKSGLPRLTREFSESRVTFVVYIGFMLLIVGIFSNSDRGVVVLVPPIAGPFLAMLFLSVKPFDPSQNVAVRFKDTPDQTVPNESKHSEQLVSILRSTKAKIFNLRVSFIFSPVLVSLMLSAARFRSPLHWSLGNYNDIKEALAATFIFSLFSLAIQIQLLMRWAFQELKSSS